VSLGHSLLMRSRFHALSWAQPLKPLPLALVMIRKPYCAIDGNLKALLLLHDLGL
jgi:hypothetical protein